MHHSRLAAVALVALCSLGLAPMSGTVQPEVEAAAPLSAHPVAKIVGLWRGTASSMGRDGQWHEAVAVERARWNLAGTAILVEGFGYVVDPETDERHVGHDAFGLIEWSGADDAPVFHAHRVGGEFEAHALERVGDGEALRWSMSPGPGTTLRFTITLTEDRWLEIGEMSRDEGETWRKFLETDLARAEE